MNKETFENMLNHAFVLSKQAIGQAVIIKTNYINEYSANVFAVFDANKIQLFDDYIIINDKFYEGRYDGIEKYATNIMIPYANIIMVTV